MQLYYKFGKIRMHKLLKIIDPMVRAFLATPSPWLPQCFRIRFILGLWFLGCIFINVNIQTSFIASMTKPGFESEISTQKELLKSNLIKHYGTAWVHIVLKSIRSIFLGCIFRYEVIIPRLQFGPEFQKVYKSAQTPVGLFNAALKKVSLSIQMGLILK